MIILIQFIFYLLFFIYKLYSLLVNHVILIGIGGKLDKYIENLKSITYNLRKTKKKKFFNLRFYLCNLLTWCKQKIFFLFVSIIILILNISLTFDFFNSNVLFITIFNKNIELSYLFGDKYIFFKILYYLLFFFFIFSLINKFYSFFSVNKKSKENINHEIKNDNLRINIKTDNDKDFTIYENGLYQNILITGSIGSGKTSCAISNVLDGLVMNNIGGLIIDIKGNYINTVKKILKKYNRIEDLEEISLTNRYVYNPLDNIQFSSIEIANIIKKVLTILSEENKNTDPFFLDKAEEYIRDFITLIRIYNNGNLNFKELHNLVINKEYLEEKLKYIKDKILNNEFNDEELFEINNAIININNDFFNLDQRTFGIIRSEITRMTSIFLSNNMVCNKFCGRSNTINFLSKKIYVLSLDISNNEKLSKIIATYMKLQFQKQVLTNTARDSPVFFICDEYQEICNKQDANFFSLSREYKCINVVSMQSYSSLINTLNNEYVANTILQNFINKIWFRNDDDYTIKKIISQIGKQKITNKSKSYSENGKNSRYNKILKKITSFKSDFSTSYSETENIQNRYNEEVFTQKLKTFETICLISDGDKINLYEMVKIKRWEEDI